jgi:hypothetical protein
MTPEPSPDKPMSEPARIAGVYIEPARAFSDIVARPQRWFIPMILVMVCAMGFIYCYSQRVGWEQMMRKQFETNTQLQNLPKEQRDLAMERGIKFAGIGSYVGVVGGMPIMVLIVAGVLMLVMNSMMGAQVSFVQSLAIVSYSYLTGVVTSILGIIVMYIKSPEDFDLQNPLAFNGAAFLASDAPKWMTALLGSLDVFTFWTMALMATGFAATTRKMKWSKAFTGVVMMWLVWVVVKTGWAAFRG